MESRLFSEASIIRINRNKLNDLKHIAHCAKDLHTNFKWNCWNELSFQWFCNLLRCPHTLLLNMITAVCLLKYLGSVTADRLSSFQLHHTHKKLRGHMHLNSCERHSFQSHSVFNAYITKVNSRGDVVFSIIRRRVTEADIPEVGDLSQSNM